MSAFNTHASTSPFTQLTFMFPESETKATPATTVLDRPVVAKDKTLPRISEVRGGRYQPSSDSISKSTIPIGVDAPRNSKPSALSSQRRNKPEHISDLLLVVLDRYGIDPNEFMAGLE